MRSLVSLSYQHERRSTTPIWQLISANGRCCASPQRPSNNTSFLFRHINDHCETYAPEIIKKITYLMACYIQKIVWICQWTLSNILGPLLATAIWSWPPPSRRVRAPLPLLRPWHWIRRDRRVPGPVVPWPPPPEHFLSQIRTRPRTTGGFLIHARGNRLHWISKKRLRTTN